MKIFDHKHRLGDLVYLDGVPYWVTGLRAKIGYGILDWEYQITKPVYHGASVKNLGWIGGQIDVDNKTVREDQLASQSEEIERLKKDVEKRRKDLDSQIADLESQREQLAAEAS